VACSRPWAPPPGAQMPAGPQKPRSREHALPRGALALALRRALRHVVYLADRSVDLGVSCFHVGMKILGPLLICLALSLLSFVTYTFFTYALPLMEAEGISTAERSGLTCLGLFLLGNTLYNYGRSVLTDPGLPPEFESARAELELQAQELGTPKPRQCGRCSRLKPPRCHHCSVCGRCVLKMDHHCPFVNTCIGLHNYRYFLMFVLEEALGCLFPLVALTPQLRVLLVRREMEVCRGVHVIVAWLGSLVVCCSLLQLFLFHMHILLRNETTLENMKRCSANSDAHLEDVLENYALVCGEPPPRHRARVERVLRWVAPNVARLVGKGKHKS